MTVVVVAITAAACSGAQSRELDGGCTKDVDCRAPRICERPRAAAGQAGPLYGICVDPRPAAAGSAAPPSDGSASAPGARGGHGSAKAPVVGPPAFAMFGGDARHTGRRGGAAPAKAPREQWKLALGGPIAGSPTIGPDGTIYVTSHAGALHAIDPGRQAAVEARDGRPLVEHAGRSPRTARSTSAATTTTSTPSRPTASCAGSCASARAIRGALGPSRPAATSTAGRRSAPTGRSTSAAMASTPCGPTARCGGRSPPPSTSPRRPRSATTAPSTPAARTTRCTRSAPRAPSAGRSAPAATSTRRPRSAPTARSTSAATTARCTRSPRLASSSGRPSPASRSGAARRSGADGTIYVGSLDRALYALAPTGQVRWKLAAADKIVATPGIAANGTILIGAQDEHLYAVAPDGTLLWLLDLGDDVDTTPAIARDGTIYVAGDGGRSTCISIVNENERTTHMTTIDRQAVLDSLSRLVTPGIKLTALADELGARKHEYAELRSILFDPRRGGHHPRPHRRRVRARPQRPPERPARPAHAPPPPSRGRRRRRPSAPRRAAPRRSLAPRSPRPASPPLASPPSHGAAARGPLRRRLRPPRRAARSTTPRPARSARSARCARTSARSARSAASPSTPPATASCSSRTARPCSCPPSTAAARSTATGSRSRPGPACAAPRAASPRCWRAGARGSPASCAGSAAPCTSSPTIRGSRRTTGRVGVEDASIGRDGDAVVVEITRYPDAARRILEGKLLKVLGDPDDPRTEIEKILACAVIPLEFPDDALAQAKQTPQELGPGDLADRIDLRDRRFATIDPETARDFDDALCIEDGPHGGPRCLGRGRRRLALRALERRARQGVDESAASRSTCRTA